MNRRHAIKPNRVILYLFLIFFAIFTLLPLWSSMVTALKTSKEVILSTPISPPLEPTLMPFAESFGIIRKALFNSIVLVCTGVVVSSFFGSILAFSFSKYRFRGSQFIFYMLIFCLYIPPQAQLIPMVRITSLIGLHGNFSALVLIYMLFGIPMSTFIFKTLYDDLPESLLEAAKLDGAGTWRIYRRIMLPISGIPLIIASLLQVTIIWNDYIWGLILTTGEANHPVTVTLANLKGSFVAKWNLQMAGALWVALPTMLIFIVLGKYIIRGYMGKMGEFV
ncbi:carbohydrate ABC transporter permease [Marispirochaeta sp.]|jgi:glucose/mannose transport system permease protein|uniref:carbohydrate ABC transporter permease n=1 Tax=Marispirochaeta sp. TaxID=2038653 RepID=UPI0029C6C3C2|nr:carbohydrate ABC transporter permease [Marispirochaeta sp.]